MSLFKSDYMGMVLNKLLMFSIIATYILSFVDLYFLCMQRKYYKLIKLSLIVKQGYIVNGVLQNMVNKNPWDEFEAKTAPD